ncbi:MAG: hypothetical protein MMC33_008860 [Icmadophila ericetorum]|nr:hypothetical protein [Icmadophila ericetorum]
MPAKQATLGKFFGQPNGLAAVKQQSKLAFKGPRSAKKEEEQDGSEDVVGEDTKQLKAEDEVDGEDVKMKEDDGEGELDVDDNKVQGNGLVEESEEKENKANGHSISMASPEPLSPTSNKVKMSTKRAKPSAQEEQDEDEDDEDEEPIRKRPRRNDKQTSAKAPNKPLSSTKAKEEKTAEEPESKPKKAASSKTEKSSKAEKPSKADKGKKGSKGSTKKAELDDKENNAKDTVKASAKPSKAVQATLEVGEEKESDVENEDLSSEDGEKPEVAAKAREKVQSTLKSQGGKDPYPDWKPGEPVPYAALCTTFSLIEMTTKRLIISAHCSLFLRQILRLTPQDLLPTVQLMINKLAADYAGIELGIGESLIMKAIGESTGRSLAVIKADQNEIGDLGLVAAKSRSNQPTMFKPKALTVRGVLNGLMGIATVQGDGSQGRKIAGIKKLLSAADANLAGKGSKGVDIAKDKGGASEAKFIVRFLEGKLRLGLAEKTVLVALAHAMVIHETEKKGDKVPSSEQLAKGESILKTVYSELPSYEVIIPAMLEHGLFNLRENCKLQPGVPLKPMLAKPTKSITEVLDRFEGKNFTCEYKYDGERAQIHYVASDSPHQFASSLATTKKGASGLSAIFSRNSEDLSKKYPDVLAKLDAWIKPETKSFVLDCETVAWDMVEKKLLPFQQLMTRKRKDVKVEDVKVKVCVFAFDMLFYNGEAIVQKSLRERRELMRQAFSEVEGEFAFAQYGNTSDLEEIQTLLEESVKASCEGLMIKMLDTEESGYEPSKRSRNWLKVKKDYLSGVGDSLDLVVLGAYFGKGKRTSVYGAFLLGCYNSNAQTYETVCNIGTGFSEAILEELHSELSQHTISVPKPFYTHSSVPKDQPDVWFEPRFIWEVKTADLTLSPRYKAGAKTLGDSNGKGISLRFPRFIKKREDKKVDEATGARQVVEMYQAQESVAGAKGTTGVDDDFEY